MTKCIYRDGEWITPKMPMSDELMFDVWTFLDTWINAETDIQRQKKIAELGDLLSMDLKIDEQTTAQETP